MGCSLFETLYARVPAEQKQMLLDFRARHPVQSLTVDGARMDYIAGGQGDYTLLFLPGALHRPDMWFYAIRALESQYRIISTGFPDPYRSTGLGIEAIRAVLRAEQVEKAIFIGLSAGALTVQLYILRHPEQVEHFVMTNAPPIDEEWGRNTRAGMIVFNLLPFGILRAQRRREHAKTFPRHSPWYEFALAYWNEFLLTVNRRMFMKFFRAWSETALHFQHRPEVIAHWRGEGLIMQTAGDSTCYSKRQVLYDRFPHAQRHIFPEGGHDTFLLFPDEMIAYIKAFLFRLPATRR